MSIAGHRGGRNNSLQFAVTKMTLTFEIVASVGFSTLLHTIDADLFYFERSNALRPRLKWHPITNSHSKWRTKCICETTVRIATRYRFLCSRMSDRLSAACSPV